MKQFLILAMLATASFAAKVPVGVVVPSQEHVSVPVKVTTPVPVVGVPVSEPVPVVGVPVPVAVPVPVHHEHHSTQKPHHSEVVPSVTKVPPHVQHVVQHAHQHIQQVVNHHVGNKHKVTTPVPSVPVVVQPAGKVGVVPVTVPVAVPSVSKPTQHHHHVHVDVVEHLADGHKHVAHNHVVVDGVDATPQHVIDKIQKVEKHVSQVMQHAHQHIPHVINHQIALKEKIKGQNHGVVAVDKVPVTTQQHHVAQHVPEVTVKTTTM